MVSTKTVETLVIVGGLAAIGGVAAYSLLKSSTLTPPSGPSGCTSDSQCPSGYICVNGQCVQSTGCTSSSQCPPNYACENGACVPVGQCETQGAPCSSTSQCCSGYTCVDGVCTSCPSGNCSCSQFWDPVSCSCQPLVPAIISPSSTQYSYYLDWFIMYLCTITGGISKCIKLCPNGFLNCGSCLNLTAGNSSASTTLQLQGQLTTSGGVLICNQTLALEYPSAVSYSPTSGEYTVTLSVSGPGTVTTDSNGNFTVNVQYTVTVTYINYESACFRTSSTNYVNDPFAIKVYVQNDPTVVGYFSVVVDNTILAYT
jgi:hypothetical protein